MPLLFRAFERNLFYIITYYTENDFDVDVVHVYVFFIFVNQKLSDDFLTFVENFLIRERIL